ncbi:MAG: hypothetical protein ACYDHE_18770 [Candidatus Acidiferrales bacterium]
MGTKIQSANSSLPAAEVEAPIEQPHEVKSPAKPKLWQRRRLQIGAGTLIALVIVAVLANNLIASQYTAEGAVRAYLSALQSGNASAAWNQVQVSASAGNATVTVADQAALQAALATAKPDFRSYDITGTSNVDANTAQVAVTFDTSKGTKQAKLLVKRSGDKRFVFYPIWRLVLAPTLLTVTLPKGAAGVSVDGKSLALSAGKSTIAVLPVEHEIAFDPTPLLAPQTVAVDAFLAGDQTVAYRPTLTDAGMTKAKAAVTGYFNDICAKQTKPNPDQATCPQTIDTYLPYSGQWHLVGDPTQDLSISSDADQNISAVGHFQMDFAYPENGVQGSRQVPAGGGYSAALQLDDSNLTVGNVAKLDGLPALQRPAGASDQAAKDLVAKGLAQCAAISAETVANCPQAAPDAIIANVHWGLNGDPVSGATVTYDGKSGLLTVHGNFSMSVSYTWFGNARNRSSYVTAYDASLFWDGQALQLITIDGAN